ncbi:4-(cytidine 5'-diphospho)-2-C-methyl-D-erythritol kinase [Marivita sp. GX14005]|uniref:4-(cytidine 5'-diphospho)-2-C-methyl-D-erythritol kinase n=1 Tax=Marivita sp. GX14005 TaxID=2942276 RepID=UPI0020194C1A|nr:4-(cytidine 5'-diphospho)-2-C-methyl-D-erythritol kinase [Marivita sp. GX14005]MCL3881821.1 4-(cytidine 5'-diphospho)-2-C-methyl-D-erythritol kinase [Marivita sp. GX14005]
MAVPIEARARAKVNLTLHVTGQRADGYHLLDSLVVFADIADRLTCVPTQEMSLTVDGAFASGVPTDSRNLAWRAAELANTPCHISLEKNVPHGAGLGGGSADAAAVLRAFDRRDLATQLGADVPVCLSDAPQRMRGIGERLQRLDTVPGFALVLVNPDIHLPTADVFRALAHKSGSPMDALPGRPGEDWTDWLRRQRNDLQDAAQGLAPEIGEVLGALKNAKLARMTGSGSTCFGLYPDLAQARQAEAEISQIHPNWWVRATRTLGSVN